MRAARNQQDLEAKATPGPTGSGRPSWKAKTEARSAWADEIPVSRKRAASSVATPASNPSKKRWDGVSESANPRMHGVAKSASSPSNEQQTPKTKPGKPKSVVLPEQEVPSDEEAPGTDHEDAGSQADDESQAEESGDDDVGNQHSLRTQYYTTSPS
ncbi:hypothetical protein BDN67DRAFT_1011270, partial [Paxillus ammoniavirescens]